ncbi:MAG: hypothetical protein HY280_11140 [Nitrospinae bacterium]|nr:hypothetical protein [Nitrospinota bacterium]
MGKNIAPAETVRGVNVSGWLGDGWRLFWRAPAVYFLSLMIIGLILLILAKFPMAIPLAVTPLVLGFYLVIADQDSGRSFKPERIFGGFAWFLPALAADILIKIFTTVGLIFLIIPGLIISSWYLLTWMFMIDRDLGFWGSMEASRKFALKDMFGWFMFFVAIIFVNLLGALCLGVGLLITVPVSATSIYCAYKDSVGLKSLGPSPELQ